MTEDPSAIVELRGVTVLRAGRPILSEVDWTVREGERWVVLGPNGGGKTTLLSIASTYLWPSRGSVSVLGRRVGEVDVRELRRTIGITSAAIAGRIPLQLTALEVVVAGATGAIAPWWETFGPDDYAKARRLLGIVGCDAVAERPFEVLSSGERQRVQIARALMVDPELLLLDEPAAGLDLGARETLALLLARLNGEPRPSAIVVVTHHVEEISRGTTHALVLSAGRVVACGRVGDVVTSDSLSRAFGVSLAVTRHAGRFAARAIEPGEPAQGPAASPSVGPPRR